MENLKIALNVVLPLFFCMALGYFLRQIKMVGEDALNTMNSLVFKVFLPVLLFRNVYTTDIAKVFNPRLILFSIGMILAWFLVLMLIIPKIEKENKKRGVLIQGIFRSNFVLFGLPVVTSLFGEEGAGTTSLLVGFVVPLFNVLAVIALEFFRGGKPKPGKILLGVIKNPLIIASALGILCYFLKIRLPEAIDKTVLDISRVATPLSLIVLGGFFSFGAIKGYRKQLLIGAAGRLVVSPLIMVPLAAVLGYRNQELVSLLIMFGSPTAVSSFTMAKQMDGDADLAAELVVFTTAFSVITIFLWVFVLKSLNLI